MRNYNPSALLSFIPNFVTLSRIFLAAIFSHYVCAENLRAALIVFALASISDFLDGYLARAFKVVSKFGAMVDPVADKILMFSAYFFLCLEGHIPLYLAIVVIARDLMILLTVTICLLRRISLKFSPLWSSKINTTMQMLYVIIILVCGINHVKCNQLMLNSSAIVVFISTIFSGAEYARKYRGIWQKFFKH